VPRALSHAPSERVAQGATESRHAEERDEREHGYGYGCGDDDQFETGDRAAKAGRPASDHDADGHKERQRDPAEQGRAPELERGRSRVRRLEQQDANLRRALRSAGPNAAERITLEIEAVAVELREATTSLSITEVTERPLRVTPKVVRQTIDEMTGILEHAPLDTRVAWVRDLFERIDVDSRESRAVAVWKAATDEGVNRLDSVSEWLRR
jgi:hypothetical protein